MEQRIPTQPLAKERTELINRIRTLPLDMRYSVMGQIADSSLLNVCLVNAEVLSYCKNPLLKIAKNWNTREFIIFRLKLLLK